jgi:hypothetical protein
MATEFNINDFLGGGSSSNFGNFGDTSTPANLFSLPNSAPSQPFAFDAFQDASFNSPQVDASLLGFQGTPSGTALGQSTSPFSPPSFADFERRLQSAQPASLPSNSFLGQPQSFQQNAAELLRNVQDANTGLNSFLTNNQTQPVVSSTPDLGLEPFNRFNPTTQQFEQLFGNQSAISQFDDSQKFLQSIRDEAQRNATNFLGQPVTNEQITQADELASFMGTDSSFSMNQPVGGKQVLKKAEYGQPSAPVSAEDLNKLLNMQKSQQAQADNKRRTEFMKTDEDFVKGIAEMNKAQEESRAAFDRASDLRTQALENRIPFNATFNYDKQGNKVLAGESARAAGLGPDITDAEARAIAKGKMYKSSAADKAEGLLAEMAVNKRAKDKAVVEEVATFKNAMNSVGVTMEELGFDDAAIAAGVKSAGSGINFARQMASILKDMPDEKTAEEFTTGTNATLEDISIKTPKQYMIKDTGEITTLGYGPQGTLVRAFPPKLDAQGNIVQNRRLEEFAADQVQLYETGDFRSDQETLSTLRREIEGEDTIAIEKLVEFRDLRTKTARGLNKIITDLGKTYNILLQRDLTDAQMREAVASAKFEGLLGSVRLEVLGPGVLTEQDAIRLIKSMGGFGFLADRDAAVRILDDIIAKKEKVMAAKVNEYNSYRTSNLALRDLSDTEGNIRFEEITFTPRASIPDLVPQ